MRVAVLDDYQDAARSFGAWEALPGDVQVDFFHEHLGDEDRVADRLLQYEAVVAMRERTPFPRSLLERLPNLRLLVTTGPFNAAIDVGAASERGVVVSGTGGILYPTAELTWALILALVRRIPAEDAAIRAGGWQVAVGEGLQGKTLGLAGLGNLGAAVARVGQAFDMDTIAWSQNLDPQRAAELGVEAVDKAALLARADVLTIHLVLSDRTRRLFSASDFAAMKPTAYLVNTSRGPIVDQAALVATLENGDIAGAGLDVFEPEPLPEDDPLRSMANTVLTPHIGYVTRETYEIFFQDVVEDIVAYLDGQPVRVVTP